MKLSTRRSLIKRSARLFSGAAVALGAGSVLHETALAAYSTYVIADGAPVRGTPSTLYSPHTTLSCSGNSIMITEVTGEYACSCNECTSIWGAWHQIVWDMAYIHRGNLNPVWSGCECYY